MDAARHRAAQAAADGFVTLKVKIGGGTVADRRSLAVLDAAPRARLILNANALALGRRRLAVNYRARARRPRSCSSSRPRPVIRRPAHVREQGRVPVAADGAETREP